MKHSLLVIITLLAGTLATVFSLAATDQQPRYDVLKTAVVTELKGADSKIEAIADVTLKILDRTNFITLKINGNLQVTNIEDESGATLHYIQDDTEKFELTINLGRAVEPGTEKTLHIEYNGFFSKVEFDFYREIGKQLYAYIGNDAVELYASSLWFPQSTEPMDRARYEISVTLPPGLQPITAGKQINVVDTGVAKTFMFRTDTEILPPSLVAGRYIIKDVVERGIRLRAAFLTEFPEQEGLLKTYIDAIKFLMDNMGYIPPTEPLQIVEVSDKCREFFGMEGTVFITTKELSAKTPNLRSIVRKLAYQKWLFPIRLASANEVWIAEGLAQYMAPLYVLDRKGAESFDSMLQLLAVDALKYQESETVHRGIRLGLGTEHYNSVVVAKSAWIFHMLRHLAGEANFTKIIQTIARQGATTPLDKDAIAALAKQVTGKDFGWFFNQWIDSVDLPEFVAEYIVYRLSTGGFQTVGKINQNVAIFQIPLEIKVDAKGENEMKVVDISGESTRLNLETKTRPIKLELDPNFRILRRSRDLEIQVYIVKGDELFESSDLLGAVDSYKKALELDPRNSLAFYKTGLVFYEQFNYNSALNTFRDALNGTQKPDWVPAMCYLYLGRLFDILGQRERAVAEYNKAINTKDDSRGAVTEAQKCLDQPFTREKTLLPTGTTKKDESKETKPEPLKGKEKEKK